MPDAELVRTIHTKFIVVLTKLNERGTRHSALGGGGSHGDRTWRYFGGFESHRSVSRHDPQRESRVVVGFTAPGSAAAAGCWQKNQRSGTAEPGRGAGKVGGLGYARRSRVAAQMDHQEYSVDHQRASAAELLCGQYESSRRDSRLSQERTGEGSSLWSL